MVLIHQMPILTNYAKVKILLENANKYKKVKGFSEWKQLDKKVSLLAGFIILR